MILELCTDSFAGAQAARKYGLNRIELCSSLDVGGLTPSLGLIEKCAEITEIEVHPIIRPRPGHFNYNHTEIDTMKRDISACRSVGAKGVVFGILTKKLTLSDKNIELIETAMSLGLECTLHRAFDLTISTDGTMERVISMGFDRLLTSGRREKAIEGIDFISNLEKVYGSQIQIMAGSGVNPINAVDFQNAKIKHLHFTARKRNDDAEILDMGIRYSVDEAKINSMAALFS